MGSINILSAFVIGVVGSLANAAQPVSNTMLNEQVRPLLTQEGLAEMEKARLESLNQDTDQEIAWKDPRHDVAGAFKVVARFKNKQNSQPCRDYVHMLRKRDGQAILSTKTQKALAFKNTVCFTSRGWEKFEGDRANLVGESGTATPAADGPSGSTGPEHRREFPNMVGPVALGQILDGYKLFKKNIEGEKDNARKDQIREQMYTWSGTLAEQMKENKKTLALDQVLILIGKVDGEAAQAKVIEKLKPRMVQVGDSAKKKNDADNITKLFRDATKKSDLERQFSQLATTIND